MGYFNKNNKKDSIISVSGEIKYCFFNLGCAIKSVFKSVCLVEFLIDYRSL